MKKPLKIAIIVAPVLALTGIGTAFALNPPIVKQESKAAASVTQETSKPIDTAPVAEAEEATPTPQPQTPAPVAPTPTPTPPPLYGKSPDSKALVVFDRVAVMNLAGIPADQQDAANQLIDKLSRGWNYGVEGKVIDGLNLCNALSIKLSRVGEDYATNPVTQLKWCHSYVTERYQNWQKALEYYDARVASGTGVRF